MLMKRVGSMTVALAAALAVTACAAGTQQAAVAPAFDPIGVYDFSTQADGETINGTITIRRGDDGALSAIISTPVTGSLAIQSVTLEGRRMDMRSNIEGDALIMMLDFVEDRITGGWELGSGMSGVVTGRRRAG
jgi:hypothetical protein